MLGWVDEHTLTGAVFDGGPYEEHLDAMGALASDDDLRKRLLVAGDGRIGRRLLSAEGLHTARWLAAALVREPSETQEGVTPAEGLAAVLNAVAVRIGRRPGQWLNSWELIGHRLAGHRYDEGHAEQAFAEPSTSGRLETVLKADLARTLSKKLRADAAGLDTFLSEQARRHATPPHEVLATITQLLTKHMMDGKRAGSVHSWKFFEGPVADEVHRRHLEVEGIRPGDAFGAHKRRD